MVNSIFLMAVLCICISIIFFLGIKLKKEIQTRRHVESSLNECEQKYRQIVDLSPDAITVYQDEKVQYINTACKRIMKIEKTEDVLGKMIWGFLHEDFHDLVKERIRYALEEKKSAELVELKLVRNDGRIIIVESAHAPIIYKGASAIQSVFRDITERKKMEQTLNYREASSKALFNAIPDLMFHITGQGVFLQIHGAKEDLYQDPENSIGKNLKDVLPDYLVTLTMENIHRALNTGNLQTYEYQLPMHGKICDYEARMVPVSSNELIILVRNITEIRKTETALIKAKESAEAASRAKSEFLANISHEIRTPMNAIVGMVHLALETELTDSQKNYLEKICSSSYALLGIINDILDFSRIESGRLNIQNAGFNLEDVLNRIFDNFKKQCLKKGINISFSVSPDVPKLLIGDSKRLGQILNNLLSNAVKFTEHGLITINIECLNKSILNKTILNKIRDKIELQFSVTDSGIGIPPEKLEHLFEAFTQADGSSSRKFGGTGLGLAISKHLVKMMNGEIRVESSPGKGSTFSFSVGFSLQSEKKQDNIFLANSKKNILEIKSEKSSSQILADNIPELGSLLPRLRHLLEQGDTDAFKYAKKINKYLKGTGSENQASRLVKQIEAYDFEDAMKSLENISKDLI